MSLDAPLAPSRSTTDTGQNLCALVLGAGRSHGFVKDSFILERDKSTPRPDRARCPSDPKDAQMSASSRPAEPLRPAIRAILAAAALISLAAAGVATAAVAHDAATQPPIRAERR